MGGSTNSFLHILALAKVAAGLDVTLDDFEELSHKIHQIVKLDPACSSDDVCLDFHKPAEFLPLFKTLIAICFKSRIFNYFLLYLQYSHCTSFNLNKCTVRSIFVYFMCVFCQISDFTYFSSNGFNLFAVSQFFLKSANPGIVLLLISL